MLTSLYHDTSLEGYLEGQGTLFANREGKRNFLAEAGSIVIGRSSQADYPWRNTAMDDSTPPRPAPLRPAALSPTCPRRRGLRVLVLLAKNGAGMRRALSRARSLRPLRSAPPSSASGTGARWASREIRRREERPRSFTHAI